MLMHFFGDIKARVEKLKRDVKDARAKVNIQSKNGISGTRTASANTIRQTPSDEKPTKRLDSAENKTITSSVDDRAELAVARYTHLKVLHDFIVEELSELLEMRTKIAEGVQESIRFEDLWHLFKPGDIIYSEENGFCQLYKVFSVTGGQTEKQWRSVWERNEIDNWRYHLPSARRAESDDDDEEVLDRLLREEGSGIGTWTPLKIDYYLMGFDGSYCGPIAVIKKIRAYMGDRYQSAHVSHPVSSKER